MRAIAKPIRKSRSLSGRLELTFEVSTCDNLSGLLALEDKSYTLDIKEIEKGRSAKQNAQMWVLLNDIAKLMHQDTMDVYVQALERADAKCEYIACLEKAEPMLREHFRAIKFMKKHDVEKGTNVYKCFYGSSKMNTKEMSELIEEVIYMASQVGIDTLYWKEVLK